MVVSGFLVYLFWAGSVIALEGASFEFGKLSPEFISSAFIFLGVVPLLFAVTLSLARKYLS